MPVEDVDFKASARPTFKADTDLGIGEDGLQFIIDKEMNHLRDVKIAEIFTRVKNCYSELVGYLKFCMPQT